MSDTANTSKGGEFATSRRGGIAEDVEFIRAKAQAGVPISAIARMVGRNADDVRRVLAESVVAVKPRVTRKERLAQQADERKSVRVLVSVRPPPPVATVLLDIARQYRISVDELRYSAQRKGNVQPARRHAYYELYMTGRYTMEQIAKWFGMVHHDAVSRGVRQHVLTMLSDAQEAA